MKIITVVGARPNFMKAAPIVAAIREHNQKVKRAASVTDESPVPIVDHTLVHTGQHYDAMMSGAFFADLQIPPPDIRLGAGSGSHAAQTAEILKRFEGVLLSQRPDVVVVVGDVNSTVACALCAAKITLPPSGTRPLVAHVEAGLRSFDRSMPEEINRILTDHLSDFLFVTEPSAIRNLRDEGLPEDSIHFVGNTMIDSVLAFKTKAEESTILERLNLRRGNGHTAGAAVPYGLLTLHRPSNVDSRESLWNILAGVEELAGRCPVVFPVHPRTRLRIREFGMEDRLQADPGSGDGRERGSVNGRGGIIAVDPLGYLDFLCLMQHAEVVVTDSGGIQEETTCLRVPCVTVRENTERPVTVDNGTNVIAGTTKDGIRAAIQQQIGKTFSQAAPMMWDGQAAGRVVEVLVSAYCRRMASQAVEMR